MSSVKATAASHSGEMVNSEPIYAINFKFLRRNIIVDYGKWIEDSTLVFIETVKRMQSYHS
jgi:hypothetical protein